MYRGMVDTTRHFESGACEACRGPDNARRAAYELVRSQPGGSNFLTAEPLRLTMNGNGELETSGYSSNSHNYVCPTCQKTFSALSGLMQHQSSRPQCGKAGKHVNLRLGYSQPPQQKMRFFHGTTWGNARTIKRNGFLPSVRAYDSPMPCECAYMYMHACD